MATTTSYESQADFGFARWRSPARPKAPIGPWVRGLLSVWAVLTAVGVSGAAVLSFPGDRPEIDPSSVVLVETPSSARSGVPRGNAFFLGDNSTLVTCHHVLLGLRSTSINLGSAGLVPIQSVLVDDEELDFIVVRTAEPVPGIVPLSPSNRPPNEHDPISIRSRTAEGAFGVTDGRVLPLEPLLYDRVSCSIVTKGGSSGSPMVNDRGEVVGVVSTGGGDDGESATGGFRIDSVLRALARTERAPEPIGEWWARQGGEKSTQYVELCRAGDSALRARDSAGALASYNSAARLRTSGLVAIRGLSRSASQLGPNRRRDELAALVKESPTHQAARFGLGAELMRKQEYDAAYAELDASLALRHTPAAAYMQALARYSTGRYDQATTLLLKCLERDPHDQPPAHLLALVCAQTHDAALLDKLAAIVLANPDASDWLLYPLGVFAQDLGRPELTRAVIERLDRQAPYRANRLRAFMEPLAPGIGVKSLPASGPPGR